MFFPGRTAKALTQRTLRTRRSQRNAIGSRDSGLGNVALLKCPPPKTASEMIVHHAGGLHECVADRGTHETKSAFFQGFAHGIGFSGLCDVNFRPPCRAL